MRSYGSICKLALAFVVPLMTTNLCLAQNNEQDRKDWLIEDGDWSGVDNWGDIVGEGAGPPSSGDATWGRIARGVVNVDGNFTAGALQLSGGTLAIGQGNRLSVSGTDFTDGTTTLGSFATVMVTGNGELRGESLSGGGTIHLGDNASKLTLSGDLDFGGNLMFNVGASGNASAQVGGNVVLSGQVTPVFNGVTPSLGDRFEFLRGADSVDVTGARFALPDGLPLERGIGVIPESTDSTAALVVRNLPILTVDRQSGAASISNATGDALSIVGYSLFSDNGNLQQSGWSSLASQNVNGWEEANPSDAALAELNLSSSSNLVAGGDSVSLGNPYRAGNIVPVDEDVEFLFQLEDGSTFNGLVEYSGAPNDLTLRIDPTTGEAEISHLSEFVPAVALTGYSILSEAGSLVVDTWNGFRDAQGDSWLEANPSSNALAEFSPAASQGFANGDEFALGTIFAPGSAQDVVFEYATANGVARGFVQYAALDEVGGPTCSPVNSLIGDLDGSGDVGFPDFLVLSDNFGKATNVYEEGDLDCGGDVGFADFLLLSDNFGKSLAAAETSAVPEPSSLALVLGGFIAALTTRRRRS